MSEFDWLTGYGVVEFGVTSMRMLSVAQYQSLSSYPRNSGSRFPAGYYLTVLDQ